jgi:hypothetical protein
MEIEINASEYSTPAELAGAIQEKISQLYVDWVLVNFSGSRHRVTPNTVEHVCKGLMMADEFSEKKPDAFALFSIAYRISQKVDERHGRHFCQYTPEQAWERLDSTHRLMWQDEASATLQDIKETMPPRVGWDQND